MTIIIIIRTITRTTYITTTIRTQQTSHGAVGQQGIRHALQGLTAGFLVLFFQCRHQLFLVLFKIVGAFAVIKNYDQ